MKRLMLSAMGSGQGKTVMTCGLLRALRRRGLRLRSFKCGPDYIDPMFHSRVLGVPCRNLDLFLMGPAAVRESLLREDCDLCLLEGAMGFYDGVGGTGENSAWDLSRQTETPAVLVLRPGGQSLSLAAQVLGMRRFRPESRIAGLLLTDTKPMLFSHLRPILERETGLPVLGYLPPMEAARLESRHLGLVTAGEISDLQARLDAVADQIEKTVDLRGLLALAAEDDPLPEDTREAPVRCRIAVARDEAFCFCYADSLRALRRAGAEIVYFSPLRDRELPEDVQGLYLPGGYPELHAEALSRNETMRASVRGAVEAGVPTVAECGGFLYLGKTLQDPAGRPWPMAGALPGEGYPTGGLRRFGYVTLRAERDSLLLRKGEALPAHSFHHWDTTAPGEDLMAEKPVSGAAWTCGFATKTLYAAFPHLHLGGEAPLAERFAGACEAYKKEQP